MDINVYGVSAVILTGILVEVAKRAEVPTKYLPAVSIISAIALIFLGTWSITVQGLITGIIIGAVASGLYDNISKGKEITTTLLNK